MAKWFEQRKRGLKDEDGVIVAADILQEWLLPWWWETYRIHNSFPVTFFDFGMSRSMQKWCKERGECCALPLGSVIVEEKEKIDPALAERWERGSGETFWKNREAWFNKPLACLQSPYRRTIWSDLDCEIRCPLDPLFQYCEKKPHISLCRYEYTFNSGIIVFKREIPLIKSWALKTLSTNHLFRGDEEILTHLIEEENLSIEKLPSIYNWDFKQEGHSAAKIIHWYGPHGKNAIYQKISQY